MRFNGKAATGRARLETDRLWFRGDDLRLSIPFKQMSKVAARGGTLSVTVPDGTASFKLGAAAASWADRIQHPPSRLIPISDPFFHAIVRETARGIPDNRD